MMSFILHRLSDKKYYLYSKGADMVILPKLAASDGEIADIQASIDSLASDGSRVICHAMRQLTDEEMLDTSPQNLPLDRLETDLTFIGMSTSQDLLHEYVAETV